MKGGMQTSAITKLTCVCGKETSKTVFLGDTQISIHFTKNGTYWHITKNGIMKRTFKNPEL